MYYNTSTRVTRAVTKGLINIQALNFFLTFNLAICAELIGLCGIVGNVISIVNFTKQGLRDSVNITLTALAVSDLGALVFQCVMNILAVPFYNMEDIPFASFYLFGTFVFFYPHGYFIRVSGFVTAFSAFERFLCVIRPMKVKLIITRTVSITVITFIFILLLFYMFPVYYLCFLSPTILPGTNRTAITIFYRENAQQLLSITNFLTDFLVPYITFIALIIFTAIIILKLKTRSKWRQSVTWKAIRAPRPELSSKDKKTMVMLTVVSAIYVICLTPECVMMTILGFVPEMMVEGPYYDVTVFLYSFTSLLETISCSATFIVYYKMSTKYRKTIHVWFPLLFKAEKKHE